VKRPKIGLKFLGDFCVFVVKGDCRC